MIKENNKPFRVLIIKTSALGDILQSFIVLDYLVSKFSNVVIDWVVEKRFLSVVQNHPNIDNCFCIDTKLWKKGLCKKKTFLAVLHFKKELQANYYDAIFDLQGNCKSGLVTLFSKGKKKVGYGKKSISEWPNLLFTHVKFDVKKDQNISLQYLELVQSFFNDKKPFQSTRFLYSLQDYKGIEKYYKQAAKQECMKIMVCPGSKWPNKRLDISFWIEFLQSIEKYKKRVFFLLIWGNAEEKAFVEELHQCFSQSSLVVNKLSLAEWQNLMAKMDLVLSVDSSSLHLCKTVDVPSFSFFGPSSKNVYKPLGDKHFAVEGGCSKNTSFVKRCSYLRSCKTACCIKGFKVESVMNDFISFFEKTVK